MQVCALSRREMIMTPEMSALTDHHNNLHHSPHIPEVDNMGRPIQQNLISNPGLSYEEVLNDEFQFDMDANDVMVFLHIQKTGGTSFGKHLVRDLDLEVSNIIQVFTFIIK